MRKKRAGKAGTTRRNSRVRLVDDSVDNSVDAAPARAGRNGGQLRSGNPGNKGGKGQPTNEIREIARLSYAQRIPILEQIADNPGEKARDRILAISELGKVGIGSKVEVDTPASPLQVGITVGPAVAAERAAKEASDGVR